ncbi:MAG: peptide deformylase [Oscillospiraceae bacterium]|jgi:peptide deformylase
MALRTIVTGEDEILHKKSRQVTVFDQRLHQLLDDMLETMEQANGVGLAAVQVGVLRRVVVIRLGEEEPVLELINPVITEASEDQQCAAEACLSYPGEAGMVSRPKRVTVQAQDRNGDLFTVTGEDLMARALCHELDHLDGIVFLDRAERMLSEDEEE